MAVDPRKRQKQLQRRSAKRKDKQQLVTRAKHANIAERLAGASKYPVLDCWMTGSLWTQGMGWVLLSRELPNGSVAVAVFLVDPYCLGVKNVIMDVMGRFSYDSKFRQVPGGMGAKQPVSPAKARKFVEDAVAYARAAGLPPHADYASAARIFGDINPADCTETFEFGQHGKPHFIAGPHDTPQRCRRILAALEHACGPDGFNYTMPLAGGHEMLPDSMDREDVRAIGRDQGELPDFTTDLAPRQSEDDAPSPTPTGCHPWVWATELT
jgi:hypothetical protein